jgi:hypothetical protein
MADGKVHKLNLYYLLRTSWTENQRLKVNGRARP